MMWSNVDPSGFCVYPDSNKIGTWAGDARMRVQFGPEVDYYKDEI